MTEPRTEYQYGPEVQTDRDFESLTEKQRNAVEAIIGSDAGETRARIADAAGVTDSYVKYVEDNFAHIIDVRRGAVSHQVASDGGGFTVDLSHEQAWKAIRLLPDDLSETIFNQIRRQ